MSSSQGPIRNSKGQFVKGQSGNPSGRNLSVTKQIKNMSNDYKDYIVLLDKWARDDKLNIKDRISCVRELLDRGLGKAHQTQTFDIETPMPIQFVPAGKKDESDTSN